MSSLPPSAVMGLHRFDTDDAFLNTEVNENTDDLDTLPPTVCTSSTRPATNLYQGRLIFETDTKNVMMYDLNGGSPLWRRVGTDEDLPIPVRGYMINTTKAITATVFTDVASDFVKAVTVPRACMMNIMFRTLMNGVAATAVVARLKWTGATTGNSYDQMDSALLGSNRSFAGGQIDTLVTHLMINAGTTTFATQAQRSNTSNAVSIDAVAVSITAMGWGDEYTPGSA